MSPYNKNKRRFITPRKWGNRMNKTTFSADQAKKRCGNGTTRARRVSPKAAGVTLAAISLGLAGSLFAQDHFNAKGSPASVHTSELQQALRESLPFEDDRDFAESRRGFIAEPASKQILNSQGAVVWDMVGEVVFRCGFVRHPRFLTCN